MTFINKSIYVVVNGFHCSTITVPACGLLGAVGKVPNGQEVSGLGV